MTLKGDLLIRGGTVVDPARNFFGKGDILVHGETITCKQIFIPQMTVRNGRVVYRNLAI